MLFRSSSEEQVSPESGHAGLQAGELRKRQGYDASLLVREAQHVQNAIYDVVRENLLSLNLSHLMLDLKRLNAALATQLEKAVKAHGKE